MTKNKRIKFNINREAAKISALSSGKIRKCEYLTGEDIFPSNQQQVIEQAKFTYCLLGKTFEKQIKTIEIQGEKQIDALKDLTTKEQTKSIEDKYNNKQKAKIIFNELINETKKVMNKLYDRVDYNNFRFEYVGPTKDVSFYDYMDSKELFSIIKNTQIKFSWAVNKQNEFLNRLKNIKIGKNKTIEQKEAINNLEKIYISRQKVIFF